MSNQNLLDVYFVHVHFMFLMGSSQFIHCCLIHLTSVERTSIKCHSVNMAVSNSDTIPDHMECTNEGERAGKRLIGYTYKQHKTVMSTRKGKITRNIYQGDSSSLRSQGRLPQSRDSSAQLPSMELTNEGKVGMLQTRLQNSILLLDSTHVQFTYGGG